MADAEIPWRTITCRVCGNDSKVLELPNPYLDPDDYVCGGCLRIKHEEETREA